MYAPAALAGSPAGFKSAPAKWREFADARYSLQVSPEDCTGCGLCVEICPAKSKSEVRHKAIDMAPARALHDAEVVNWDFFPMAFHFLMPWPMCVIVLRMPMSYYSRPIMKARRTW